MSAGKRIAELVQVPRTQSARMNCPMFNIQSARVSVGLPVYNGEAYLPAAIDSILGQSFSDFELIISDNGSGDATPEICAHYAAKDSRVSYYRNERNLGAAANYNRVVELARGELFVWVNHDDVWADAYLERCVAALDMNPQALLSFSRSARIDPRGDIVLPLLCGHKLDEPSAIRRLRRLHALVKTRRRGAEADAVEGLWAPVYGVMRTDLLRKSRLIGSYISSDTVLLEELLMLGPFVEVDEILFFKRDHPDRSMRACRSYDRRSEWFKGRGATRLLFPRSRLLWERLCTAACVPVSYRERAACLGAMLVYYAWPPRELEGLVREMATNVRRIFGVAARKTW
jgi:glycosyltransferase involved in cell wall biosynthesis